MEMNDLFVLATRKKFRFPYKGMISVEELWDLSITELDKIFKVLNSEMKQMQEESLLSKKSEKDMELEGKIHIVRYIVKIKQDQITEKTLAAAAKAQKEKIEKIIAAKKDKDLESMSIDQLEALLLKL